MALTDVPAGERAVRAQLLDQVLRDLFDRRLLAGEELGEIPLQLRSHGLRVLAAADCTDGDDGLTAAPRGVLGQRFAIALDERLQGCRADHGLAAVRRPGSDSERLRSEDAVRGRGQDLDGALLVPEDHRSETASGRAVRRLGPRDSDVRVRVRCSYCQDESGNHPTCIAHSFPPSYANVPRPSDGARTLHQPIAAVRSTFYLFAAADRDALGGVDV